MYRRAPGSIEIFLVHPGGPFWKNKDAGAWTFPKGEYKEGEENPLAAALREFHEETGRAIDGEFIDLGAVEQKGGKIVRLWAVQGDFDASALRSNTFEMEWPPKSGLRQEFPEADRGGWFSPEEARHKLLVAQAPFVDRLCERVAAE